MILVPTMINDKPVKTRFHRVWDKRVRALSGGLTILTPARGNWICNEGKLYDERMLPVMIFCTKQDINEISDFTAAYYKQKAIMFFKLSNAVSIIDYDDKGKRK